MTSDGFKRKLTAILSADVVGYSRLMSADEASTVKTIKTYREIIFSLIKQHSGRIVDSPGDNILAEFASVVDAAQCAVAVQKELKSRNADLPEERRMVFRIGINLGDIIEEDGRIYGDGVNVAARLEALCDPGGICISKTAFDQIESKLPLGYEYMGEHALKNIPKPVDAYRVIMEPRITAAKGYKEKKDVPLWRKTPVLAGGIAVIIVIIAYAIFNLYLRNPAIEQASVANMAFPIPDKPSIAVLPFTNKSGDPDQEYFSDGLTEDLITDLSKFSGMFVISRISVFLYKGMAVKPKQVSEDLGVRFVLEGSVRKSGDQIRITVQLIDAISGGYLWVERYDRNLKDIFSVQDELVEQILSTLRVRIRKVEQERAFRKETANLNAFDYDLRGWWYYHRYTEEDNNKARKMFERAIELEPTFASAHAGLGFTYYEQWARLWSQDPQSLERAYELAKKSIALNDTEAGGYALLGHVYLWRKQFAQAIIQREKAITLDENNADLYQDLAETLVWAGKPKEAITSIKKAMRLNPHYPVNYEFTLGFAHFSAGRYDDAIIVHKKALIRSPDHLGVHIVLAMSYGELGREEESRYHVKEALRINPQLTLEALRERLPIDDISFEHHTKVLIKSGIPISPPLTLPEKPSIAVLPFTNMSNDPKQDYFSDGITEDLITDLSKISGLFVIARNSVFIYKGKAVKIAEVGKELGIRYILEGSVRKAGDKVRITAQLLDAHTEGHLWAERYDRDLKDIFKLQDEVTQRIVSTLAVKITEDENLRLIRKGTNNLEAYDYTLRGLDYFAQMTMDGNIQARKMFEKAIDLDPQYALCYSLVGETYMMEWTFGWSQDTKSVERAFELTQKALSLDDSLHIAHQTMGDVYLWKKQHDKAISSYRKAIALNPNDADGYYGLGSVMNWAGQPEEAGKLIKKAMRLNPMYPVWYLWALGQSHFLKKEYKEAIDTFVELLRRNPNFFPAHPYLAASYHELDRDEEARFHAEKLAEKSPQTSLDAWKQRLPYKNQEDLDHLFKALHDIGMR